MLVNTLDGKQVKWRPKSNIKSCPSSLHIKARAILKDTYPTVMILEEVSIPIQRYKTLYLDFYIPIHNLAIEVDGSQHFTYSKFFFKTKRKFNQSLNNDYYKSQFCEINNITLIRLNYGESIEQWRNLLLR